MNDTADPRPPLAVNLNLTGSARFHALEMENDNHEYFAHTSAETGDGPNRMAVQNGYNLFGDGLDLDRWTAEDSIESIARGINQIRTFLGAIELLIVDEDLVPPGHRIHLLAMNSQFVEHREIGAGMAQGRRAVATGGVPARFVGRPEFLYAIHTAWENIDNTFITGVVFADARRKRTGRFDKGEGLGGVLISAAGDAGTFTTVSLDAGGYSLMVPPGAFTVTAVGEGFVGESTAEVTVGADNVEVDFASGLGVGEVNFEFRDTGPPPSPPPPPAFELLKAVAKLNTRKKLWTFKLARALFRPGVESLDEDLGNLRVVVEGQEYFAAGSRGLKPPKIKRNKKTNEIKKIAVKTLEKHKLVINLRREFIKVVLKNLTPAAFDPSDGVNIEVFLGDKHATLDANAELVGKKLNKAVLESKRGEVGPIQD